MGSTVVLPLSTADMAEDVWRNVDFAYYEDCAEQGTCDTFAKFVKADKVCRRALLMI